ncbi:porin [Roseovarius aquimarinus]|uniref:Porin n=1 Tax=Roseovarius aquimarinus TaxID=1229156 RepID=A0ABW7I734_9RHOB
MTRNAEWILHNVLLCGTSHKNYLLGTSALALGAVISAPVSAQEWNVPFTGFMSQHVGYADLSGSALAAGGDFDGVDIHSSTEIIFTPSITLDNGLTFGVNASLEGENTGQEIDESYFSISGDTLGKVVIGSENPAGYTMMVSAPIVTAMYINSPSISTFIPFSAAYPGGFLQAGLTSFTEVAGNDDVQRLSYYTPSFNGLTLGISYAPTGMNNVANSFGVDKNTVLSDIFDIGANYTQTFGSTSVSLAARYGVGSVASIIPAVAASAGPDGLDGTADDIAATAAALNPDGDPETWGIGAQIGFGDFMVGGSYAENDNGGALGAGDSSGWNFGATYDAPGAWSFEVVAYLGETDIGATNAEYNAYRIGASRDLGPGVDWDIYVVQLDADDGVPGAAGLDVEGTVLGTGINLSF